MSDANDHKGPGESGPKQQGFAASIWADLKRGAGALAGDVQRFAAKLRAGRGKKTSTPAPKPSPYPESAKYAGDRTPDGRMASPQAFAWRDLWGSFAGAASSLAFLGAIAGLWVAFLIIAPRVPVDADLWNVNRQSAIIVLDRNGEEIAARGARYGEAVEPEELPPYFIQAILSTEDRRFYQHRGVDLRGTMRAAMANARSGGVVEGGSTITQQLARNLFLSFEQTYIRKAKEALLALWLEGRYSKDEIFSLYINRIYLGAGSYGVESAALTYFGKSIRDVTLAEAAMIAGLPKAPSTYAPTQNPKGAERRAAVVIDNLLETGFITPFEAREATQNPARVTSANADSDLGYFFDYAAAKAKKIVGPHAGADLIVTTTIDQKLQRDAEAAVAAAISVDNRLKGAEQAALVAYDASGALRAMVGGRSYKESQFNRAVQAKRQPGSAFKPFVYVAALESGLKPSSRFIDQPINYDGWGADQLFRRLCRPGAPHRSGRQIDQHRRRASLRDCGAAKGRRSGHALWRAGCAPLIGRLLWALLT